jgi:Fe2+ or Zn2+ uptake regulation protein
VQLACFVCGRIRDFADPTFELIKRQIGVHTGFEIGTIRIQASGQCSECHSRAAELAREIAGEQPR